MGDNLFCDKEVHEKVSIYTDSKEYFELPCFTLPGTKFNIATLIGVLLIVLIGANGLSKR